MPHDFYLAWRYLRHHRLRSVILVACLGLTGALPLALHRILDAGETLMTARAAATPLLVGARGSALDLTLSALYFSSAAPSMITMAEVERIGATGWADALPIHARFRVHGQPLVGVTLDYFDFRHLFPARGQLLAMLGDCVLGARAATTLGLKPGDTLLTTPENLFDLAGIYPLKLRVAGVLERSHTPDDEAVFVDLQTAWVIEGLGHGHAGQDGAATLQAGQTQSRRIEDAKLLTYTEITSENVDSFHFHGDPGSYPVTAVIAVPPDQRATSLLRGRYLDPQDAAQIVDPAATTESLLQNIFRVGALFDGVLLLVGIATLLVVALVFVLSMRLRQREIDTIVLLGCSRLTVVRLAAAELILIATASAGLSLLLLALIRQYSTELVRLFVIP
ncbi:MAG: hypothetical protein FJ189_01745 [Gammaproteobacteria bacterium]|nr:hypothetical protein [Gammaproteobacteria bacterium]